MDRFVIIGYSGHAYVVLDACKKSNITIKYYCDRQIQYDNIFQLDYLGNEGDSDFDWHIVDSFVLGIGDNGIRHKVARLIESKGKKVRVVIHPTAIVNDFVEIGAGTFIASNAVINPLAKVGKYCIINTGAIVEHECKIDTASHIAPGVVLAGNVTIGSQTFVGANSVIRQGISIGDNVTIGAGSVVIRDIPSGETWVGNPAKKIK